MARKRHKKYIQYMDFRKRLWIRQHYRCNICQKQIRQRNLYSEDVNLDHIRPRAHGGSSDPDNLAIVHLTCNRDKGSTCAGCDFCRK